MTTSCNASVPNYAKEDEVIFGGYNIPKRYVIIGDYASQNKNKNVVQNTCQMYLQLIIIWTKIVNL